MSAHVSTYVGGRRGGTRGSRPQPSGGGRLGGREHQLQPDRDIPAGAESPNRKGGKGAAEKEVGKKKREAPPGGGHGGYASVAAQIVWRGYAWAEALQAERVFCDKASAAEQQSIKDAHAKDGPSCVYLSLLAFHRAGDSHKFFDRQWGEVPRENFEGVVGEYARMTKTRVAIHMLWRSSNVSDKRTRLDTQFTFGEAGARRLHLLLVPGGQGQLHCLPLGKPDFHATVECPPLILDDVVAQAPKVEDVATSSTSAAPQMAAADGKPATTPPAAEVTEQKASSVTQSAKAVPPVDEEDEFYDIRESDLKSVGTEKTLEQYAGSLASKALSVLTKATYRGIQPPPISLYASRSVEWRGGWFASQCPKDPNIVCAAVMNVIVAPDFASATLDNFEKFGTSPVYCAVRLEKGLQLTCRRTITDGRDAVEFFTAGDTLHHESGSWRVLQDGPGLFKVEASDFGARLRSASSLSLLREGVAVHAPAEKLGDESLKKAKWGVVCLTNKDPVETALLTRMRGDEARDGYKGADPESAADLVRVLAKHYRGAGNVAGPYGWGGCYSCGKALSGKVRQRICCNKQNTTLARMIAEGCKVTSVAAPVRYPGVVWTKTRHPPLKPGTNSTATGENFPTPHRA